MNVPARVALTIVSLLFTVPAVAKKPDCSGSVAAVQAAVIAACDCATAATHGQFVRCAAKVVKGLATDGTLARNCRGAMVRGVAKSTCGKPDGVVTCCLPTRCSVKKAAVCARLGGTTGTTSMCLDACLPGSPSGAFVD